MNDSSQVNYPISGECQCGNIRYQLLARPHSVIACHCKQCQKLSSSAFSLSAIIKRNDLQLEGKLQEWQRVADSGRKNFAKFCPHCGNRIYHFDPDNPEWLKLKPSNLCSTADIVPSMHIWISEKQSWFSLPDNVTTHPYQPESLL